RDDGEQIGGPPRVEELRAHGDAPGLGPGQPEERHDRKLPPYRAHDERQPVDALDPDGLTGVRPLVAARLPKLALDPDFAERTTGGHDSSFLPDHRLRPGLRLPAPR